MPEFQYDRKVFVQPVSLGSLERDVRRGTSTTTTTTTNPGTDDPTTPTNPGGPFITPPVIDGPAGFPISYLGFPVGTRPNEADWFVGDLRAFGWYQRTFLSAGPSGMLAINLDNLGQATTAGSSGAPTGSYEIVNGVLYVFGQSVFYWTGTAWALAQVGGAPLTNAQRVAGQWWAVGSDKVVYALDGNGAWSAQSSPYTASPATTRWLGVNGGRIWVLGSSMSGTTSTTWYTTAVGGNGVWTSVVSTLDYTTNRLFQNEPWVPLSVLPNGKVMVLLANRSTMYGAISYSVRAELAADKSLSMTVGGWRSTGEPDRFSAFFAPSGAALLAFTPAVGLPYAPGYWAVDTIDITGYGEFLPANVSQGTLRWRPGFEGSVVEWTSIAEDGDALANRATVV